MDKPITSPLTDLQNAAKRYYEESMKPSNPISYEDLFYISMSPCEPLEHKEMKPSLQIYFKSIRIRNTIYEGVRK